ncbi:aspartate kinase [Pullulanibacillus sp. KACC 23026]|uniref:aspartate kinase n=1 Tax=Pullulanibacillus sp. KACC 23026 TaxID=3028315 RepID=UPI0023B1BBA6|nr:aspartate kinase [Pullulanibacillus sp. KACC 23026]WEG13945.1 aspartate kinase [Pullulanibacillus sp. KACC 23026]
MTLQVMKFGGTSVGSIEKIQRVGSRIQKKKAAGYDVIVVVSAMGKTTDHLVDLAAGITVRPSKREMDMLLATGEQQTMALLAMYLINEGIEAVSMMGWQAGMVTEASHGNARIADIKRESIQKQLNLGKVVIVAGFQGVTEDFEITTLGRGGSDTSAVALAAAFKAELCEIYTDVEGVYTTDPRYVSKARKLAELSYDEMLEMANLGAGVLHPRSVENAKKYKVPLVVRSSFNDEPGTIIKEETSMETGLAVSGLAFEKEVTKITLLGLPNKIETLSNVFKVLAGAGVNVDIIIQNALDKETTSISFTIASTHLADALDVLKTNQPILSYSDLNIESNLAKVSIIGSGMVSNPGVAADMFEVMSNIDVKIKMVSTSEIKVSTVIPTSDLNKALEALHEAFHLDSPLVEPELSSKA